MSERFAQYDGGKGPEDRSDVNKRANSPLWKIIKLSSGVSLSPEEAAAAILEAHQLLSMQNTTPARNWCDNYFPQK
ncbi:MAG: hypothetical protein ACPH5P_00235 [Akkermansiaceae bacterium]